MDASDFTTRLIIAVDNTRKLIDGGSVDARTLIAEGRALAQASRQGTEINDEVHRLAAVMVASFAEAWISKPGSLERRTCLSLCRLSRTELRRLRPYDCQTVRTLWAIGSKADELAVMGVRIQSPQNVACPSARPLQDRPFAEALYRHGGRPAEPEHALVRPTQSTADLVLTGPAAEKQYFSASEYWPNTGAK